MKKKALACGQVLFVLLGVLRQRLEIEKGEASEVDENNRQLPLRYLWVVEEEESIQADQTGGEDGAGDLGAGIVPLCSAETVTKGLGDVLFPLVGKARVAVFAHQSAEGVTIL